VNKEDRKFKKKGRKEGRKEGKKKKGKREDRVFVLFIREKKEKKKSWRNKKADSCSCKTDYLWVHLVGFGGVGAT